MTKSRPLTLALPMDEGKALTKASIPPAARFPCRVHSYRTKDAGNLDTSEVAIYTSQPPMRLGAQTLTQISNLTLFDLSKHTLIHYKHFLYLLYKLITP